MTKRSRWIAPLVASIVAACAAPSSDGTSSSPSWPDVQVHGALRAMHHEGQTGPMVTLDAVLPDPDLYGVGALADLAGEITIVAGQTYLSYPEGHDASHTEVTSDTDAGAALLVSARVPTWRRFAIERAVDFEQLDDKIAQLAAAAGLDLDRRIPFSIEGTVEQLQWHVIDGSRLEGGGTSHADHLDAAVKTRREAATATLIGFYSEHDQGVFTHMGSRTHIHCVVGDPESAGHVDHVRVPAGASIEFPVSQRDD